MFKGKTKGITQILENEKIDIPNETYWFRKDKSVEEGSEDGPLKPTITCTQKDYKQTRCKLFMSLPKADLPIMESTRLLKEGMAKK